MKRTGFLPAFLLIFSLTALLSCGGSTDEGDLGLVRINLTDAPGPFEAVEVTVNEVSIHFAEGTGEDEGEWIIFPMESQVFDLMNLQNGRTALLGEEHLEPGIYSQIRLKIDAASVTIDGEEHDLDVPVGAKSGLKLNLFGFVVESGLEYDMVIDFDASRSVFIKGPEDNPTGYQLQPVIRATFEANTGAIEGSISDVTNLPTVMAITGTDTVGTIPDGTTGEFLLGYLPAATYTVEASDTTGAMAEVTGVEVTVGTTVDVGELTLTE